MWRSFFLKENIKLRWAFSVLCSIYVVVFYVLLKPSKNELITYQYPRFYDIFGILCYFVVLLFMTIILPKVYSDYFKNETWNLKRFTIWYVALVIITAFVAFLFDLYFYNLKADKNTIVKYFFDYQFSVDFFTAFPVYLLFLGYNPKKITSPNVINSPILNEGINDSLTVLSQISFSNQFEKNLLTIQLEQLYYISSSDNYIDIFYKNEDGILSRMLIRNTLKWIEEQYENVPLLFRCHKGYIVNCQKVKAIKGNAKGYFLVLEEIDEKIPVSRNKNEALEKLFSHLF